ncbi:MAG: ferredoxin [Candidatus Bathyarchaeia archaeon]
MKYKIEVNREDCIACGTCYALDQDHFEAGEESKSKVVGGTTNGKSEGYFDDDKIKNAQEAEQSCPVSVIKVTVQA